MYKDFVYGFLLCIVLVQAMDYVVARHRKGKLKIHRRTVAHNENNEYCRPDLCDEGETHIGCVSSLDTFSQSCGNNNILHAVDGAIRNEILILLNTFRNYVASGALHNLKPAAHMPLLKWDNDLANLAKLVLLQCDSNTTYCNNLDKYHFVATSEITANVNASEFNGRTLIDDLLPITLWDIKGCKMDENNRIVPKGALGEGCVGHYLPLIQDHSSHIGCAARTQANGNFKLRTGKDAESFKTMAIKLICNFSRGNVDDLPSYTTSDVPGSECKAGLSRRFEFLCSADEKVNPNSLRPKLALHGR